MDHFEKSLRDFSKWSESQCEQDRQSRILSASETALHVIPRDLEDG